MIKIRFTDIFFGFSSFQPIFFRSGRVAMSRSRMGSISMRSESFARKRKKGSFCSRARDRLTEVYEVVS